MVRVTTSAPVLSDKLVQMWIFLLVAIFLFKNSADFTAYWNNANNYGTYYNFRAIN